MPATGSVQSIHHASRWIALAALSLAGCQEDSGLPTSPRDEPVLAGIQASAIQPDRVAQGAFHSCVVATDNRAYCWGDNSQGQLGDGTTASSSTPVAVAGGLRFIQLSLGYEHSCGVTVEQRVYCWGFNFDGQLGDGTSYPTNITRLVPVPVQGNRRFTQVRAGHAFTCGVTESKAAFCWGNNTFGQLGDATATKRPAPVRVLGGHLWRRLESGDEHVCAVTTEQRAYCWGMGWWGQIGDGTEQARGTPTAVAGTLRFLHITAGGKHSCGITTTYRIYCWGDNNDGQLGDGTGWPLVLKRLTPVAVVGDRRYDRVVAGSDHTCGVTRNARALCWGWNGSGQLGNGTTTRSLSPGAVLGGLSFEGISTMSSANLGLTTDGRLFRWGQGQLRPVLLPLP